MIGLVQGRPAIIPEAPSNVLGVGGGAAASIQPAAATAALAKDGILVIIVVVAVICSLRLPRALRIGVSAAAVWWS